MKPISRGNAYSLASQALRQMGERGTDITKEAAEEAVSILTRDEHFTRRIEFTPAFDKRDPDPVKNYGIGCVKCTWLLSGPRGGITWEIFTNWMLPSITKDWYQRTQRGGDNSDVALKVRFSPTGGALELHAKYPSRPDQDVKPGCNLNGGEPCYFDVWYSIGDELLELLIEKGGEEVWKRLEEIYVDKLPQDALVVEAGA